MSNTILTHDMLVDRMLFEVRNQLVLGSKVYTGYRDAYHAVEGFKKGATVRIPLPNRYRVTKSATLSVTDTYEQSTNVTVDIQAHVALRFTGQEWTLHINRMAERHLKPAARSIANQVDYDGFSEVLNIYNLVGTKGTTPSTFGFITAAAQRMDEEAIPRDEPRYAIFSPKAHWSMANGELKSVFQQNIVDTMLRKGFIGQFGLFDFFMSQNVQNHTTGDADAKCDGATVQVKTTSSEGDTTLALKGFASGEKLSAGTVFTVSTVAGVNPESGGAWEGNTLRQFVVTAEATADGSGDMTVNVSPKIISSAAGSQLLPYQTVNDLPATNDYITSYAAVNSTAYPQNVFFVKDAFCLTCVPFAKPQSAGAAVKWVQASDEELGLSLVISTDWDSTNFRETTRVDTLYGWDTIMAEGAVRGVG